MSQRAEFELDNGQICAVAAAIGIARLVGFHAHMPDHALLARRMKALEQAIAGYSRGDKLCAETFLINAYQITTRQHSVTSLA